EVVSLFQVSQVGRWFGQVGGKRCGDTQPTDLLVGRGCFFNDIVSAVDQRCDAGNFDFPKCVVHRSVEVATIDTERSLSLIPLIGEKNGCGGGSTAGVGRDSRAPGQIVLKIGYFL